MDVHFNFTRKQLEEFIYDLRIHVNETYISIILNISNMHPHQHSTIWNPIGLIVCSVPSSQMDLLVKDARKNLKKTIDEFINDYHHTIQKNQKTVANQAIITWII